MRAERRVVPGFANGRGTRSPLLFSVYLMLAVSLTVLLSLSGISSGDPLASGPKGGRAEVRMVPETALNPGLVAGTFVAFGPADYIRSTKKPTSVADSFSILNPNTIYTLHVYNGGKNGGPADRVSSAIINLNGTEVVGPSEFSRQVPYIEKPITPSNDNELAVEVRSGPGDRLTIEIIGIDNDPPTIVATLTPPPNAAGWNNTDVTVSFKCSDMTSGVAFCSGPVVVTTEGAGQVITGHATDMAGNTASTSVTVNLDETPPAIAATQAPPPNVAGWNNTDITVGFQCSDLMSGIASCSGPIVVAAEGAGQVVTGHATDIAGNTASTSVTVNLDKTAPSVTIASPADGATLDSPSVNVTGTASDAISGIAVVTCNGTPVSLVNSAFSSDVPLVRGDNPITVKATDVAGNIGHASITVIGDMRELEVALVYKEDDLEFVAWFPYAPREVVGFYRPIVPSGFYSIGHYAESRDLYTHARGFTFAVKGLTPTAIRHPIGFEIVSDPSIMVHGSIWRPVPPQGYVCLGFVSSPDRYEPPDTTEVVCVRRDLVVQGKIGNTIGFFGVFQIPTLSYYCAWQIIPADANGIFSGTCTVGKSTTESCTLPTDSVFCLDARSVRTYDMDEQAIHSLVQTQGPVLYLHSEEDYFLDDPVYVLNNMQLTWGLVDNEGSYDGFSFSLLGSRSTFDWCLMSDVERYVESHPDFGDPRFRYYLFLADYLKPGSLDRSKALVRVRPWNHLFTDIQFWFFYPFNGPGRIKICASSEWCLGHFQMTEPGRHYGDWEHVTLRFSNMKKELVSVYLSRHSGGAWIPRKDFDPWLEFQDKHPVIYSAKYSHAHYPNEGIQIYARLFERDYWVGTASGDLFDLTDKGFLYEVYLPGNYRIVSSEVPSYSVDEPDWLRFEGRWGQHEKSMVTIDYYFDTYVHKEVGRGPTGPAQKGEWKHGASSEHWWWMNHLWGQEACLDGIDNDGDGKVDCFDEDCSDFDFCCKGFGVALGYAHLANIAPPPPSGLMMASATELAWDECADEDFDHFTVYGSAAPGLGSGALLIGQTTGTAIDVSGHEYQYYHVTVTDTDGNEGSASSVESTYAGVVVDKDLPQAFALKPNRPNPFASRTVIAFDLPEPCAVRLKVVDIQGRSVRVLTDKAWPAGRHSVVWTGENDAGDATAPGVYFVRIETGEFTATNKILLMK